MDGVSQEQVGGTGMSLMEFLSKAKDEIIGGSPLAELETARVRVDSAPQPLQGLEKNSTVPQG
jgi:hypothetical protein